MRQAFLAGVVLLTLFIPARAPARADTTISVDLGWNNFFRPGCFTPLFVTASNDAPRQVVLELYAPHDRRYAMTVRESFVVGPQPVTIPMYAPLSYQLDETIFVLRDASSGKRVARHVISDDASYASTGGRNEPRQVEMNKLFVGLSGEESSERLVERQLDERFFDVGYLEPARLAATPAGYDGLDLLLLNQPDLARLDPDQQRAIAAWVRAGGTLILWPGARPLPASGPLIDLLPATIGDSAMLNLDAGAVAAAGLPARFAKCPGRVLTPRGGAEKIKLFGDTDPPAWRGRADLGRIMIIPMDMSGFLFDSLDHATRFWTAALRGIASITPGNDSNNNQSSAQLDNGGGAIDAARQGAALAANLDDLADVPGAGTFGFSYLAGMLILMMIIVGPVDWIVLKRLGLQPWTWVTTSGWIALVTFLAIMLGSLFKSGDLYFRTATVVDESNDARVACLTLAGIYSPRTADYSFETDPHGWWAPAADMNGWMGGGGLRVEVPFHQDFRGNRPTPMLINVWNSRMLQGESLSTAPALIEARLSRQSSDGAVAGTITNRSPMALKNLRVRTRGTLTAALENLAPGESRDVKLAIKGSDQSFTFVPSSQIVQNGFVNPYARSPSAPAAAPSAATLADLAARRSSRIDALLREHPDLACIYAEFDQSPDSIKLTTGQPEESHRGVVRALITLK
jgi:hypothetical protein